MRNAFSYPDHCMMQARAFFKILCAMPDSEPISQHSLASADSHGVLYFNHQSRQQEAHAHIESCSHAICRRRMPRPCGFIGLERGLDLDWQSGPVIWAMFPLRHSQTSLLPMFLEWCPTLACNYWASTRSSNSLQTLLSRLNTAALDVFGHLSKDWSAIYLPSLLPFQIE